MNSRLKEIVILSVVCIIFWIIIGLCFNKLSAAFSFGLWLFFLYNLPFIPWISLIKLNMIEKFALVSVCGLAFVPIIYFIIGVLDFKLNALIFALVSLILFVVGIIMAVKKK